MLTGQEMNASHTPGPWEAISADVRTCRKADGSGGLEIARGSLFWPERKANAHLIAAAPEMLEALKNLVQYAEYLAGEHYNAEVLVDARAAIAKAKGQL